MEYKILEKMFEGEKPTSVFEFGCANGGLLKDLAQSFPGLVVGGADMNQTDLERAKLLHPQHKDNFLYHNVNDLLPIPSDSYDIVFGVGILMYVLNPQVAIEEAIRIAKKKVIFAEFHFDELSEVGSLIKVNWPPGTFHLAVGRNYTKMYDYIKKPASVVNSGIDKHIITYVKN